MKSMIKEVKRFNKLHTFHTAELDTIESYPGYYVVYITDTEHDLSARMMFLTVKEFKDWVSGVVLY